MYWCSINKGYRYFVVASCWLLAACQLQRLHQPETVDHQKIVLKLQGLEGYQVYKFKQVLTKQLALLPKQSEQPYLITVTLALHHAEVGYATNANALRAQERVNAHYVLTKRGQAAPLCSGEINLTSSFNVNTAEEFSTFTARKATVERVIVTLAEEMAREIMVQLAQASALRAE